MIFCAAPVLLHRAGNALSINSLCAQSRGCIGPWRRRPCRRWQWPPRQARKMRRQRRRPTRRRPGGRSEPEPEKCFCFCFGNRKRYGTCIWVSFGFRRKKRHMSAFLCGVKSERRPSRWPAAPREIAAARRNDCLLRRRHFSSLSSLLRIAQTSHSDAPSCAQREQPRAGTP